VTSLTHYETHVMGTGSSIHVSRGFIPANRIQSIEIKRHPKPRHLRLVCLTILMHQETLLNHTHVLIYEFLKFVGQNWILVMFLEFDERSFRTHNFLFSFFFSHFFESFDGICPVEDIWAVFTVGSSYALSLLRVTDGLVVKFTNLVSWRRIFRGEKTVSTEVIAFLVTNVHVTIEFTNCFHLVRDFRITETKLHFTCFILFARFTGLECSPIFGYCIHHRLLPRTKGSCNWHTRTVLANSMSIKLTVKICWTTSRRAVGRSKIWFLISSSLI